MRRMAAGLTMLAAFALQGTAAQAAKRAPTPAPTEFSSQAAVDAYRIRQRPRTRIRVHPSPKVVAPPFTSNAPVYPGPGAVRECRSWLEPEYRLAGTVIVPRTRCWWVRR